MGSRERPGMPPWISNLVFQQQDKQEQAPSKGQACLEMLAGALKMHHFFPRAAKIQPKSARAQQLTLQRQHRQQPCLPHAGGHRAGDSIPAAHLETEKEQLESSMADKPSAGQGCSPGGVPASSHRDATSSPRPGDTTPGAAGVMSLGQECLETPGEVWGWGWGGGGMC